MRYHLCLILEDEGLKDAAAFAPGKSMQLGLLNKPKVLLGDMDPIYMSHERDGADNNVLGNTVTVKMTGEGDENSTMDVWLEYSIEATIEKEKVRKVRNLSFKFLYMICLVNQF